ncbi:MAG TPA: hypothetical protein VFI41_05275 [Gemmatimonadales bacterium]|nr:hypothetical protein [Gemmatimonadales bacterium]
MSTLQKALDEAVLVYRTEPTEENRLALLKAMERYHDDFLRREREEALARGVEIYIKKEK